MSCACLICSFVARKTGPRFFAAGAFVLAPPAFVFVFCAEAVTQSKSAHASAPLSALFIKVLLLGEVRRRGKRRTFAKESSLVSGGPSSYTRCQSPGRALQPPASPSNLFTPHRRTPPPSN